MWHNLAPPQRSFADTLSQARAAENEKDGIRHARISTSHQEGVEAMRLLDQFTRLLVFGLMLSGVFAARMFAQTPDNSNRRDRMQNETTITGCLNKGSDGNYTLTDDKTGVKTTVKGPASLEKHSANHKVALTGADKTDASGNHVFEVDKIQHISASCSVPSQ